MHALVLHNMGPRSKWREAIADLELALPRYGGNVRGVVHDIALPVPRYLREFSWDLIVINSTVLGAVTAGPALEQARRRLDFVAESDAFKVALPQDDYYCSEELDQLVTDLRCDMVYTVCPEHWDLLYPRYRNAGGTVALGYTGYVTPRMRRLAASVSRAQRRFDVVYRATGRPGFPNELALVKARLGDHFLRRFGGRYKTDISTDDRKVITGAAWWRFLANSRATLGSNSGSSVLIRNLSIASEIAEYQAVHPTAEYSEVVSACIPPEDRIEFTAVSPRLLEAALVETTQMLVPGAYSGVVKAGIDYWPLNPDSSNTDEIETLLSDYALQSRLAAACKAAVLDAPELQIETFLDDLIVRTSRHHGRPHAKHTAFERLRLRHSLDGEFRARAHYAQEWADRTDERVREIVRGSAPTWLMRAYRRVRRIEK